MEAAAAAPAVEELERQAGTAAAFGAPADGRAELLMPGEALALAREWAELGRDASEPNIFLQHWFLAPSFRNFSEGEDLRILVVRQGSRLTGLMPLRISTRYGRLPVRHVENWRHHHAFLGTPLVRRGEEACFWTSALLALDGSGWAPSFLHVTSLAEDGPLHEGLRQAAAALGRPCDIVLRHERAFLESDLSAQAYYERTVRKKKRKELKRLASRLAEAGTVAYTRLDRAEELDRWCNAFLDLEKAGWKGEAGSALACDPATADFFRECVRGAFEAGQLDFLRMSLDDRPIAMLVNFIAAPGSFSFKIAFDESYARFSPGVLIQLENLRVLERGDVRWMDSCASENHPMINSLWAERRRLVRVTVPLAGSLNTAVFRLCRLAENCSAAIRRLNAPAAAPAAEDEGED